jgi:hypothetical protein
MGENTRAWNGLSWAEADRTRSELESKSSLIGKQVLVISQPDRPYTLIKISEDTALCGAIGETILRIKLIDVRPWPSNDQPEFPYKD